MKFTARAHPMPQKRMRLLSVLVCSALLAAATSSGTSAVSGFVLITEDLEAEPVRLLRIDDEHITFSTPGSAHRKALPVGQIIAVMREPAPSPPDGRPAGMLRLVDGRQFPGELATPASTSADGSHDVLAWHSNWFGRMEVRLEEIDWVTLQRGAILPPPGRADVVLLTNGDVLEGFITSIRKAIEIEVEQQDRTTAVEIPTERVAAITMVSAAGADSLGSFRGRRAWLADGTIIDVRSLDVDEGGIVRLTIDANGESQVSRDRTRYSLDARHLAAVLLARGRMMPVASLEPSDVSGPPTRYTVPGPRMLDANALLELSSIEVRGPLSVTYSLPERATRFAAEAVLPEASRARGDFWLVVRGGHDELMRERVNRDNPHVGINVSLAGADGHTLTIELVSGESGPIQNHIVLKRAMLLIDH